MTGWHERRHVVQPVDVYAQPAGEDVLDRRGEHDNDADLDPGRTRLLAQHEGEQPPGAGPEGALQGQRRAGVDREHQQHPHRDDPGDADLTTGRHR
jgi:hypothetical protein